MAINSKQIRVAVAALLLSAGGFVQTLSNEDFRAKAYIPVPGDKPTLGFGSTNGVKIGDTTTVPVALQRSLRDVGVAESAVKKCIHVPMAQGEYDAATDFTFNLGATAFCNSSVAAKFNSEDYAGACDAMLKYVCGPATAETAEPKCSKPGHYGRVLAGLVKRRMQERETCYGTP